MKKYVIKNPKTGVAVSDTFDSFKAAFRALQSTYAKTGYKIAPRYVAG